MNQCQLLVNVVLVGEMVLSGLVLKQPPVKKQVVIATAKNKICDVAYIKVAVDHLDILYTTSSPILDKVYGENYFIR